MATETAVIETWLQGVLASDATITANASGGVWTDLAPEGTAFPYLVCIFLDGRDLTVIGGRRVWTDCLYAIKAVGRSAEDGGALETLAARIDALLQAKSGTAASGTVCACVREQPLSLPEDKHGTVYRHVGGIYRIQAQS